jgi:hypothetical protein
MESTMKGTIMSGKLSKSIATACGLAALLALGACDDRGSETAAERAARNETAEQARQPLPRDDAAASTAAQRSGSARLTQGGGT